MQKAKAAVSDFMSKSGHHDTTVHESVAPSVQHETVKPHRHEDITTAVDREVHQDHYHHTVQPVQDREVLPEQHHHNLGAVQHKEYDHRDHEGTKRSLAAVQGGFKDEQKVQETTHTQAAAPTVSGEHVHHHIHETIQPVVHKETVQPHVVHTTVPIHETHHHAAKHHETSTLEPLSMAEFKQKGGILGGREEKYDGFEGEPKNIGGTLAGLTGHHSKKDSHHNEEGLGRQQHGDLNPLDGKHDHRHGTTGTGAGVGPDAGMTSAGGTTGTGLGDKHGLGGNNLTGSRNEPGLGGSNLTGSRNESGLAGNNLPGSRDNNNNNLTGKSTGGLGAGGNTLTGNNTNTTTSTTTSTTTGSKPGLMSKLNPMTDSNGDGKAGFMK